jgi:hypothetical protein
LKIAIMAVLLSDPKKTELFHVVGCQEIPAECSNAGAALPIVDIARRVCVGTGATV